MVGADGGVAGGMEVAVARLLGLFIVAKDDAGFGAGGLLVQEIAGDGEVLGAGVQVAAEEGCGPRGWSGLRVVSHKTVAGFL